MIFSEVLSCLESDCGLKRKEIIARLQLYHVEFAFLDDVTFSRWVNNVSSPTLYKQLLLVVFFNLPLVDFIRILDKPKIAKKALNVFENIFDELDESYHRLHYYSNMSMDAEVCLETMETKEYWEKFGCFYQQLDFYSDVINMKPSLNPIKERTVISIEKSNYLLSHVSFILNPNKDFRELTNLEIDDSDVFVNVSYYSCREYFHILLGSMMSYVAVNKEFVRSIYFSFRDRKFIKYIEMY
ncbi:hypothetical protein ACGRL8_13355 [Vibrio rumoiensis]|uniref:XRE family transcriptional regulator n=1 Tax=Vibrio rumoiensis TaxID=76258 RepID=A0ABW7J168_9VIBR